MTGGADGVDAIVLRASGALERTDLDDRLTGIDEEHNQAGGEAAGPLQRPDPPAGSVLSDPGEHPLIAVTVRGVGQMSENTTSAGVEDGQVDGVAVWVTSDDEVVLLCEHDHCGCPSIGRTRKASAWVKVTGRGSTVRGHADTRRTSS